MLWGARHPGAGGHRKVGARVPMRVVDSRATERPWGHGRPPSECFVGAQPDRSSRIEPQIAEEVRIQGVESESSGKECHHPGEQIPHRIVLLFRAIRGVCGSNCPFRAQMEGGMLDRFSGRAPACRVARLPRRCGDRYIVVVDSSGAEGEAGSLGDRGERGCPGCVEQRRATKKPGGGRAFSNERACGCAQGVVVVPGSA